MPSALVLSSRNPRLPTELISLIFDFLASDKDWLALGACSLLSHKYFRLARKLLFSSVTLRLRTNPNPILIRDVSRRIQGLCDMLKRDPEAARYIKTFEVLDSYPVYDSQWITQQARLPRLIEMLTNLTDCTFGCEVGYLTWTRMRLPLMEALQKLFSQPQLKTLTLCNMGALPITLTRISVPYLYLNNITTTLGDESPPFSDIPFVDSRLCYLNVRTVSLANTQSAWEIMQIHAKNLKMIKWRCWEDAQTRDGISFPGTIDLGKLPSLKKISLRMSYGKVGRDLTGFCELLESATRRSPLVILELAILFPLQSNPHLVSEIDNHVFWKRLASALLRTEYGNLRQVTMELTVHEKVVVWNGKKENSVTEFRKKLKIALRPLLNISSFHFKFKVRAFHLSANE